jgi:hypothetical protein
MIVDDAEYFQALFNQVQKDKIDSQEKKVTVFCLNQDVDSVCSCYMLQVRSATVSHKKLMNCPCWACA